MNPAPRFQGIVEAGKLKIRNIQAFHKWLSALKGEVDVIVRKRRKDRSLPQNRYLWVLYTIIAEELGYYPEEVHDTFKAMFLVDHGGKFPVVRSTTRLNTVEFTEYIEKVRHFCAEKLNIDLPDPDTIDV